MRTRLLLLAAILVYTGTAIGADSPRKTEPIPLANGAFFALSVQDIQASGAWYREKLGLKVLLHPPRGGGPGEVLILEGGGLIVELIQHDDARALGKLNPPVSDPFYLHGFFKSGVFVANLDAALALLKQRGVTIVHGPYAANDNIPANFIISDNAGNLIQVFGK